MRCAKARKLINNHVDHLLDGKTEEILLTHLEGCDACRDIYSELKLIVNDINQLDPLEPSEDLWPAVRSQVAWEQRKTDFKYTWKNLNPGFFQISAKQAFSFAMVFIVVGMLALTYLNSPFDLIRTQNEKFPESLALTHFKEAESHYQMAINALDKVVKDQGAALPPEIVAIFKQNLEIIDASIDRCRMVIKEDPENIEANNYLLICYKKKMDLLNDMRDLILRSS